MPLPFKVFPLRPNSKVPMFSGWKDLATDDVQTFREWKKKTQNFGVVTGKANSLVVLDFDLNDFERAVKDLKEFGCAADTYVVQTRKGFHFYYRTDAVIPNSVRQLGQRWDVRGEGGYVVAPGSVIDGFVYKRLTSLDNLKEFPKELADKLKQKQSPPSSSEDTLLPYISQGFRHNALLAIAGVLKRYHVSPQGILDVLQDINERYVCPKHDYYDLLRIVQSVAKYPNELDVELDPGVVEAKELIEPTVQALINDQFIKGLPTGLPELDELLGGGKRLGEITVTHAKAKTGKNTFWHWLMVKWLKKGIPIGYASRELPPEKEVIPHIASILTGKNLYAMQTDPEEYRKAVKTVADYPLYFAKGYGTFPWERTVTWIQYLHAKKGVRYFWIDHLHYCVRNSEDYKETSEYIRRLKALVCELNIHVDLIIQPTKVGTNTKGEEYEVTGETLRGGAALKQAVDNVLLLKRVGQNMLGVEMNAVRSKRGKLGKFVLRYNPETLSFEVPELPDALPIGGDKCPALAHLLFKN